MNDSTPFDRIERDDDAIDAELRRRFDAAATAAAASPSTDDADAVLETMRPRLRRAQVRHRTIMAGAAVAAVIAAVAVFFSVSGPGDRSVRTPPATHSTVPQPSPAVTTTRPAVPTTTLDDHGTDSGASGNTGTAATSPAEDSGGSSGRPSSPSTPAPPTASGDHSYTSAGGSVTVTAANGTIALASSTPAAGFTQEVHDNGPTRVEVRFNDGQTEWRVRVDLVNGQLVPDITQH
jgi:hypothetical protein